MTFGKFLPWLLVLPFWHCHLLLGASVDVGPFDSLRSKTLQTSIADADRYQASKSLAQLFLPTEPDSALKYINLSLDLLPLEHSIADQVELLLLRANSYIFKGYYEDALYDLQIAQPLALESNDSSLIANTLYGFSLHRQGSGKLVESIEYKLEALDLYQALKDSSSLIQLYGELSTLHDYLENEEKSLQYEHKVAQIALLIKDTVKLSKSYNNLAVEYEEDLEYEKALHYYLRAFDLRVPRRDSANWTFVAYNIVSLSSRMGDFSTAEKFADILTRCSIGKGDIVNESIAHLGMAELLIHKKQLNAAQPFIEKALGFKSVSPNPGLEVHVSQMLSMAMEQAGYFKESLDWFNAQQALQDSLQTVKRKTHIEALETQYNSQAKDIENAKLLLEQTQSKANRQRMLWIAVLTGSGLVIFLGFMIWNNWRKTLSNQGLIKQAEIIQSQNEILQSRNALLDQLNQEKDALMGIVAHDLKAPLSKAAGLLSILQAQFPDQGIEHDVILRMEKVFDQGNSLIAELVLLNELDSSNAPPPLAQVDVNALVVHSIKTFQEIAARKKIQLHLELLPIPLLVESHAPYLQRILDNLLSNALKFSSSHTHITVSIRTLASTFEFEVRDQGPGIPEAELPHLFEKFTRLSNRPTAGESTSGLGLSIVESLTKRLGGRVSVDTEVGVGTGFVVAFG